MIDTHCHINRYSAPHQIAQEADHLGIITVAVTNLPSHFEQDFMRYRSYKRVRLALGLHPLESDSYSPLQKRKFKNLLSETSFIGEVGLDSSREGKNTLEKQIDNFRFVLSNIRDRPRFVTIHSRGAEEKVLQLLEEYGITKTTFHWYSGPFRVLDMIISAGHYLSINPAMVQSEKGKKIIERVPRNQILTETDGPYVLVNKKPAQPQDVKIVINYISKVWGRTFQETEQQIYDNFYKLLELIRR